VARAGRAFALSVGAPHGALAVSLRCERDAEHPGTLVLSLEPPARRAQGDAPAGGDAWDAAGQAALRPDSEFDDDSDSHASLRPTAVAAAAAAAEALALPPLRRRRARSVAATSGISMQHQRAFLRQFDITLGRVAWAPAGAAAAALARKLRAEPGDDIRMALRSAAANGAGTIVFIDRRAGVTLRRSGTALRRALLSAPVVAALTAGAVALRALLMAMPPRALQSLALAVAVAAAAMTLAWYLLPKRWVAAREAAARTAMLSSTTTSAHLPLVPAAARDAVLGERDAAMATSLAAVSARLGVPPAHLARLQAAWCDVGGLHNALQGGASHAAHDAMAGSVRYRLVLPGAAASADADVQADSEECGGDAVVAVVGAAHVAGIAAAWEAWRARVEAQQQRSAE
jgi:hypothetical protein